MKAHRKLVHSTMFMLMILFPFMLSMGIQITPTQSEPLISSPQIITQYEFDESLSFEERKDFFLNISKINNNSFYFKL